MKKSFRSLFVWEASVELAVRLLGVADRLVAEKRFALAEQLVRASCSVPNNIAEGRGRSTTRDRRHYLVQARGSLYEVDTRLEILTRAGIHKDEAELATLRDMVARIECGLTKMIDHFAPAPLSLYALSL